MRIKLFIITISLFFIFCTPPKVTRSPQLPEDMAPAQAVLPIPSIVNVPLELKTWYLQKMLNEQLSPLLYECDTFAFGGIKPVKIKVWKKDSIIIGLNGNELSYRVPVKIQMQFQLSLKALGFSHTEYQDIEAEVALKFRSKFTLKNDWKIETHTESDGYEWLSDPVVKLRFLSIPVTPLADLLLSGQTKRFGSLVDSAALTMLNVKKMMLPIWNKMQQPMEISQSPQVWLRLSPQSISMTQLAGQNGTIRTSVGIRSVAETFFGPKPETKIIDSLPAFTVPDNLDSSFVVNLYSDIPYETASEMLQGYLVGRSFKEGDKELIVQDVNIYGLDGYAIVSLSFTGSYRGKVYVIGHVAYEDSTSSICIRDLDFDMTTKNTLHATAGWLFHGAVLSKLQPFLQFPLHEKLMQTQLLVQKMIAHKKLSENVFVSGALDSLSVSGISLTNKSIRALVLAKGSLQVIVHD